jgi:lysozyme family protein
MAKFSLAIGPLLKHEGGFVDHPSDPGGATNWGISLRFLRGLEDPYFDVDQDGDVDADDIKALTRAGAINIYREQWWERYNYGAIEHQALANKVLDLSVNMGPHRAHTLLQQAARAATGIVLRLDGALGPNTLRQVNSALSNELLAAYRSEAAGFYRSLNKPDFIKGWLNRAYA